MAYLVHLLLRLTLVFLEKKRLLIEDQIVENAREEDALEHEDVSDDLTCKKSVLQFRVLNKVVKPLFTKAWHSAHFEEVRRLEPIFLNALIDEVLVHDTLDLAARFRLDLRGFATSASLMQAA